MTPHPSLADIETELGRLGVALGRARRSSRRSAVMLAATAVAMLAAMTTVLLSGWAQVRSEFTHERIAHSLSREMEHLGPAAMTELLNLGEQLLPVFGQHGAAQLQARGPDIEHAVATQLDELLADLQRDTRARLFRARQHIRAGTEAILLEQYPELDDPEERARLVLTFMDTADQAIDASIEQFVQRYSQDVDAFAAALGEFDMLGADVPTYELQRQLIHLWLQAIDERVMNS